MAANVELYPTYIYYPRWQRPSHWTSGIIRAFEVVREDIDSAVNDKKSDEVLQILRPELEKLGFVVEQNKTSDGKIHRPVFFAENGRPERQYQIDAYHPHDLTALEVEAGRSTLGNAIYRDIVQMSLLVDVEYAAVAVPRTYRYSSGGKLSTNFAYNDCKTILEAIYGGRRLELPFKGFLLLGY
jgi:hypothetical protein